LAERLGGQRGAEEPQRAGVLFFDVLMAIPEAVGDFAVREEFDFAQKQNGAATLGQFGDGVLEKREFLAGHDLLLDAGPSTMRAVSVLSGSRASGEMLRRFSRLIARRRAVT